MAAAKSCVFYGLYSIFIMSVCLILIYQHVSSLHTEIIQGKISLRTSALRQVLNLLDFISSGTGYCEDIISPHNTTKPYLKEGFNNFLAELQEYDRHVEDARQISKDAKGEGLEGYSAQVKTSLQVYWRLANLPFVNTVCETGFNAGHSSFLWLSANPKLHVYSFDIGIHKYARKMAAYLQNKYPQRLNVTWGDSIKMLPIFCSNHSDIKCDLVIIDGGHSAAIAKADFDNFYHLANDLHVVLMDDHPAMQASWGKGPREAWEGGKLSGKLYEIGGCTTHDLYRGISIGFYILGKPR